MVLDLSEFNTILDWNALKNDVEGVILRAGYRGYGTKGTIVTDGKVKANATKLKELGIPFGLYFFSQAVTENEGKIEGEFSVKLAKELGITNKYIWFDSESSTEPTRNGRADNLTKDERTRCALAFIKAVEQGGYIGGVYASTSWFNTNLDFNRIKQYPIWVANYGVNNGKMGRTPNLSKYDMWQYTSVYKPSYSKGCLDASENTKGLFAPIGFKVGDKVKIKKDVKFYKKTIGVKTEFLLPIEIKAKVHTIKRMDKYNVYLDCGMWFNKEEVEKES